MYGRLPIVKMLLVTIALTVVISAVMVPINWNGQGASTAAPKIDHLLNVMIVLSAATGAFSLYQLRSAARDARQLSDDLVSGLDLIAALQFDVQEARRRMLYALTTTDANLQVEYVD